MNSENKENLSNYQLLKREPSVCSTSLLFSKFITVVQFFFRVTPVLQWFQLNFGAGNFRGRRPGTSALRMLLRLTAVKGRGDPQPGPDLAARIRDSDLITNSGFFDHPTACLQLAFSLIKKIMRYKIMQGMSYECLKKI